MILNNSEILARISSDNMIDFYSPYSIKNSSYKIRIKKIIEPKTGKVIHLHEDTPYLLQPSKILLFQSTEKIKLPDDITASYSALYSIASIGVLLINASMIEPDYTGHLSGVLLNFSKQNIAITPNYEIAKLNFYKLNEAPNEIVRETISDTDYLASIVKNSANNYHESFLDIEGLEQKIESNVLGRAKTLLTTSGVILAMLIVFATLEPLFSRWIWEKTGLPTGTEKFEIEKALLDINNSRGELEKMQKEKDNIRDLQIQIDSLKQIIRNTKSEK